MKTATERREGGCGLSATVQIGLRASLPYAEALRALAEHDALSIGGLVRRAVEHYAETSDHIPPGIAAELLAQSRRIRSRNVWQRTAKTPPPSK